MIKYDSNAKQDAYLESNYSENFQLAIGFVLTENKTTQTRQFG